VRQVGHDYRVRPLVEAHRAYIGCQRFADFFLYIVRQRVLELEDLRLGWQDPRYCRHLGRVYYLLHLRYLSGGVYHDYRPGRVVVDYLAYVTLHASHHRRDILRGRVFKPAYNGLLLVVEVDAVKRLVVLGRHYLDYASLHLIREIVQREDHLERVTYGNIVNKQADRPGDLLARDDVQVALYREELQDVDHVHRAQVEGDLLRQALEIILRKRLSRLARHALRRKRERPLARCGYGDNRNQRRYCVPCVSSHICFSFKAVQILPSCIL